MSETVHSVGAVRDALERADPHAIPGRVALARERRREAQFLDAAIARARGLREPIDRLRNFRRAGEQPLDRAQIRGALGAGHRAIGVVGVDHARMGVGDDQAVGVAVGDRLGGVESPAAAGKLQHAESVGQQAEDADDRERGDGPRNRLAAEIAEQDERGDRADEAKHQQQQQAGIGRAFDAVDGGGPRRCVHSGWFLPGERRRRIVMRLSPGALPQFWAKSRMRRRLAVGNRRARPGTANRYDLHFAANPCFHGRVYLIPT